MKAIELEDVEALFPEATKAFEVPSKEACRSFASALMLVQAQWPRKDIRLKPSKDARTSAMALLRHLEPLRKKLAVLSYDCETMGLNAPHFNEELGRIDAVVEAIEELLPALERAPIAPWLGHDPIRFLADKAQEAWASANDGNPPIGNQEEGPLVKLITGALDLINMGQSQSTVSKVLRGKRRPTQ
jgi:hypothetical protein